ncbi:MAG: serine/threonine protein kinase, partial [Candidatus Obscuribacterales bacterium]|nr:serine/threonine protein kinase [Candidatus Obscuribacterales bacterium]
SEMLKDESRLKIDESRLKQTCDLCQRTIKPQGRKALTGWILNWNHCACKIESDDSVDKKEPASSESVDSDEAVKQPEITLAEDLPELPEKYELISIIGSGGMGSVLKVRDRDLDKILAIKLLQKELSDNTANRKRFEQEAEAASKLDHDNLVSVYGYGETENKTPYLIMDYIEGESLAEILDREGKLEPERALKIFSQIADALSHAHLLSVIHRDIKPTNIIISTSDDGSEKARIVDFGIAKVLPDNSRQTRDLTQTGEVFGSPQYMSPEQCLGFMLDQRSDIYSLGCLMYESLTGAPPFSGINPIQLVVKHINDDIAAFPPELKSSKLVQNLERIVMHCLEKDQTARFQTTDELIHDFDLVASNKQIPKYHTGARAKPTLTKRQTIGAVSLTFLVLFYVAIGGTAFSSDLSQRGWPLVLLIICGGGIYVFLPAGLHMLQKLRQRSTPRQWWLAFTQLYIGMLGLAFTPFLLKQVFYSYQDAPYWYNDIALIAGMSQFVLTLLAIVSAIGYFLPSSDKKVRLPYIAVNGFVMAFALISFVTICFPKQISPYPIWLARTAELNHPEIAIPLYKLGNSLDKTQAYYKIPQLQMRLGQLE